VKAFRLIGPKYRLSKPRYGAETKYDITDTLVHLQKIYEAGYVTYPRSSCEYIPEEHFAEASHVIDAIRAGCPSLADMLGGVDLSRKSAAWDTSKIAEHYAITPTAKVPLPDALSEAERKIYELICARYALQFLPNFEYEETIIEFKAESNIFKAIGRTITNLGWQGWDKQNVENEDEKTSETAILPAVRQGETGKVQPNVAEKTTHPPQSYTYHSLLTAMNGIHVFVKDPDIRQKLKEIQGIGTEATQENIIAVLFKRGYLEKKKKQVISTNLGQLLIDLLKKGEKTSVMVYPDMTALWEQKMTDIESGELTLESFVSEVAEMTREILSEKLDIPADIASVPGMTRQHRCLTENCEGFLRHIHVSFSFFLL
jgi:DNA topoisomerase-3